VRWYAAPEGRVRRFLQEAARPTSLAETPMSDLQTNTLLMIIIAILIPPLAVFLKRGVGMALLISIILTLLFYIPGLIHALYVILKT
jgi:uncharacterized membrane protein YqaE (UPF0057 family)